MYIYIYKVLLLDSEILYMYVYKVLLLDSEILYMYVCIQSATLGFRNFVAVINLKGISACGSQ